jgi:hypothetical protein
MSEAYCKNTLCEGAFIIDAIQGNNQTTAMLHVIAPISQIFLTCTSNKYTKELYAKLYELVNNLGNN